MIWLVIIYAAIGVLFGGFVGFITLVQDDKRPMRAVGTGLVCAVIWPVWVVKAFVK